jgi:hypothetical protein
MLPEQVQQLDRELTQRLEDKFGRENVEAAVKVIQSTAIGLIVATNPELALAKAMVESYTGRDMETDKLLTTAEKADRFAQAIPGYTALKATFEATSGYKLTDFSKLTPTQQALAGVGAIAATMPAATGAVARGTSKFEEAAANSGANIERAVIQEQQAASAVQRATTAEATAAESAAAQRAEAAKDGGLNLFKWKSPTTETAEGWKKGDYMLFLPDKGNAAANWAQNERVLLEEMQRGKPIFDSFRDPVSGMQITTQGFLGKERALLEQNGWIYDAATGAYHPPGQ